MNWLLIVVIVILAANMINGYRLGFVRKICTVFSFFITILAASAMSPYVSSFLTDYTPLYDTIKDNCKETIAADDIAENEIEELELPEIVKKLLLDNDESEDIQNNITDSITDYLGNQLAVVIIDAIAYIISFALISIILNTAMATLNIIAKLPLIRGINQYAGLILGGGQGIIIIWILFLVVTIISGSEFGKLLLGYIEDNAFLKYIYDNNYIYNLLF